MSPPANSDRLRPRRRASQTHFFRYQQAANPLRAEGEDLKKALIASLQDGSKKKKGGITVQETNTATTTKAKRYAALRKFASNQTRPTATTTTTTTSPSKNCPPNHTHDRTPTEYFPKTYKPDTEDFLNFLCVRLPPPKFGNFEYSTLAAAITAHARGDYLNRLSSKITNDNLKKDMKSTSLADEMNNLNEVSKGELAVDKYLIKGLMTSEFAGAFADEETLFDLVTTNGTK